MKLIFAFMICFLSPSLWAQEVVDLELLEKIPAGQTSDPKTTLTKQAVEKVSLDAVESFIGKEKLKANRKKIDEKVIGNSSKYLLSLRTGQVEKQKEVYTLSVNIKLSLKNLRALLLSEGLLYQVEGDPHILSLVRFSDQVALQSYAWWDAKNTSPGFAKGAFEQFAADMENELKATNFKLRSPWKGDKKSLGPVAADKLSVEAAQVLAVNYKAAVLLRGEVTFSQKDSTGAYLIQVQLTATQTSNGRVMADVQRRFETQPGSYRNVIAPKFKEVSPKIAADLIIQLDDAWKKGTFGTQLLKLVVRSNLKPPQMEAFKKTLLLQVRDIKGIRERMLSSNRTTYDIDSATPAQQLAQTLKIQNLSQFKVQVDSVDSGGIEIEVSPL